MSASAFTRKSLLPVLLTVLLLIPSVCAVLGLSASAAVTVTIERYDGTMTTAYEPCSLCFRIGVSGAPAGADIQYMWQVTVGCLVSDGRWFDGSECSWDVPCNTDTLWVEAHEGNSALADGDRFVYRCRVTVNGTDYYSQNFWVNTLPSGTYDTIRLGLTKPAAGAACSSSFTILNGQNLTPAGLEWFCERGSDKSYYKMASGETFAAGNRYYANAYVNMSEGWKADFDTTKATVNDVGATLLTKPGDPRTLRIVAEYFMDGNKCVPIAADPLVKDVLAFLESGMNPFVADFDNPVDVYVTEGSDLHLLFPARPLSESWKAKGYDVVQSWEYRFEGKLNRQSNDTNGASFTMLNAEQSSGEQTLTAKLRISAGGKVLYGVEKSLVYRIHVVSAMQAPVVYGSTQGTLTFRDGDNKTLMCRASGSNLKYQWMVYRESKYGGGYTWQPFGSNESLLVLKNLDESFDGLQFKCRVHNDAGSDESVPVFLVREGGGFERVDAAIGEIVSGNRIADPSVRVLTGGVTAGETVVYYAPDVDKAVAAIPSGLSAFLNTLEPANPGQTAVSGTYFIVFTFGAHDPDFFASGAVAYVNGVNIPVRERSSRQIVAVMRYDHTGSPAGGVKGDVNGDGEVDVIDYLMVKRQVLGTAELTPAEKQRADVNLDGEIDVIDYTIVKRIALGIGMG